MSKAPEANWSRTTEYGFEFGPAKIERWWTHEGYVAIGIVVDEAKSDEWDGYAWRKEDFREADAKVGEELKRMVDAVNAKLPDIAF